MFRLVPSLNYETVHLKCQRVNAMVDHMSKVLLAIINISNNIY